MYKGEKEEVNGFARLQPSIKPTEGLFTHSPLLNFRLFTDEVLAISM